jgi:hypothetical protein
MAGLARKNAGKKKEKRRKGCGVLDDKELT